MSVLLTLIPGQPFWSYVTGLLFMAMGVWMFFDTRARAAATLAGVLVLLFALLTWVPWLVRHPQDTACANYVRDMGLAGGALILAGAVRRKGD